MLQESNVKVYVSEDYSIFNRLKGNREINPHNLDKLRKSIEEQYYPTPIYVNEHMEIVDGQHRAMILEELGKPIYYIILEGATHKTIHNMNTYSMKWTLTDYAKSFAELGLPNYVTFMEFREKYSKVPINVMYHLFIGTKSTYGENLRRFKSGEFEISNLEYIESTFSKLMSFSDCRNFKFQSFLLGVLKVMKHPYYNHERMAKKFSDNLEMMDRYKNPSMAFTIQLLTDVYNQNYSREQRVYFDKE